MRPLYLFDVQEKRVTEGIGQDTSLADIVIGQVAERGVARPVQVFRYDREQRWGYTVTAVGDGYQPGVS